MVRRLPQGVLTATENIMGERLYIPFNSKNGPLEGALKKCLFYKTFANFDHTLPGTLLPLRISFLLIRQTTISTKNMSTEIKRFQPHTICLQPLFVYELVGVPPQHMMHMMQPNGFGMGPQLPPNHMLPPHLSNGQIPPHMGGMMTAPPTSGPSTMQPPSMPPHSMAPGQQQMGPPPVSMPQQQQQQQPHMITNPQQQQQPAPSQSQQPMNRISGQFSPIPQSFQHTQQTAQQPQQLPPQHMVPLSQHQQMPQPQQQHQQQQQYQHNPGMQPIAMQMPPHSQHQQHIQHLHQQNPSPNHNMMAVNMAMSQPVTNTILPQSDSRTNIPIYQQQR